MGKMENFEDFMKGVRNNPELAKPLEPNGDRNLNFKSVEVLLERVNALETDASLDNPKELGTEIQNKIGELYTLQNENALSAEEKSAIGTEMASLNVALEKVRNQIH